MRELVRTDIPKLASHGCRGWRPWNFARQSFDTLYHKGTRRYCSWQGLLNQQGVFSAHC